MSFIRLAGLASAALIGMACLGPYAALGQAIPINTAVWMYKGADGDPYTGPRVAGSSERLVMPKPQPQKGDAVVGLTHVRSPLDLHGYPLHISLLEKLFANANRIELFSSNSDQIWSYPAGSTFGTEKGVENATRPSFEVNGPMRALGAVPQKFAGPFTVARTFLAANKSIPATQKMLGRYVVMFVDTSDMTWMEFAPLLARGETVQLGCRTRLGRDMVIGISKRSPGATVQFIPCF